MGGGGGGVCAVRRWVSYHGRKAKGQTVTSLRSARTRAGRSWHRHRHRHCHCRASCATASSGSSGGGCGDGGEGRLGGGQGGVGGGLGMCGWGGGGGMCACDGRLTPDYLANITWRDIKMLQMITETFFTLFFQYIASHAHTPVLRGAGTVRPLPDFGWRRPCPPCQCCCRCGRS